MAKTFFHLVHFSSFTFWLLLSCCPSASSTFLCQSGPFSCGSTGNRIHFFFAKLGPIYELTGCKTGAIITSSVVDLWFPEHKIQEDNDDTGGEAERRRKKTKEETERNGKNIDSLRASETDCKENDPALRKTEVVSSIGHWNCLSKDWERSFSQSRTLTLKLYSNLIQSPPFSGNLRPVYRPSVLHRKKHTYFCGVEALELFVSIWFWVCGL